MKPNGVQTRQFLRVLCEVKSDKIHATWLFMPQIRLCGDHLKVEFLSLCWTLPLSIYCVGSVHVILIYTIRLMDFKRSLSHSMLHVN